MLIYIDGERQYHGEQSGVQGQGKLFDDDCTSCQWKVRKEHNQFSWEQIEKQLPVKIESDKIDSPKKKISLHYRGKKTWEQLQEEGEGEKAANVQVSINLLNF